MKIEIVMPTINLWNRYTKAAIDSVMDAMMRAKDHGLECHLILVDNNSTDETMIEAPKMESELFHYHRNTDRWGFQKSVNFGVNYGWEHGADMALVCNNDIVLHPEAIWRLAERLTKGDVGMATCMDVRGEMREYGRAAWQISVINAREKEQVDEAPHPNFSAFMLTKQCWDEVGEFDELFYPAYFEDNDYHRRMQLAGVGAVVHPPAMFYHYGSRTQNEASENGQPMVPGPQFENCRAFYAKKWGGVPGSEKFDHPYGDETKSIKSTQQS